MGRVTWRGVRQHPVRFALSMLAVVLGIAFMSGTFSLRGMLSSTFDDIVDQSMTADVYVQGAGADDSTAAVMGGSDRPLLAMDLADTVGALSGVARATPDIQGSMVLVGADGTAVGTGQAPSFAVPAWTDDPSFTVVAGKLPTEPGQIALEKSTQERSGLTVGQSAKVLLNGQITDQKVVGTLSFDAPMAGATLLALDPQTAEELFAPDGLVPTISVYAAPGTNAATLAKDVEKVVPADAHAEVVTGAQMRAASKESIASMLGFIPVFLGVFAGIALFVGGFIISNTFTMVVRQRLREIAVLRAIGASPMQVFVSVVGQAAIVGLIGSALGVLGGFGLVALLKAAFSAMGMELAGSIPVGAANVIGSILLGTLVAVAAAALPAIRASKVPPVEAMRDQVATSDQAPRWRAITGTVVFGLGVAAVVAAVVETSGALLGVGAVLVLAGALVVSPVIAPVVVRILAWPVVTWVRPLGALARGNVVRNPRRTANTAGALMIGMALVGAASVLAGSFQASVADMIDSDMDADYVLQGSGMGVPAGAVAAIKEVDGVKVADELLSGPIDVDGLKNVASSVTPGTFPEVIDPRVESGSMDALDKGEAMVHEGLAESNGWHVGDTVTLTVPSLPNEPARKIRIGAIVSAPVMMGLVVMPQTVFDDMLPESMRSVVTVLVTSENGDAAQLREGLTAAVKPYYVVSVLDKEEFTSSLSDQVNQMLVAFYALLGLSIVIAVLGIVNTLALSIMERTREIGLLRAVGLGRLQLSGTIVIESVLIAVFGAVAGLAIGLGLAATLPTIFADDGLSSLVVPWPSLVVMLLLAAVVGVLAALWPAIRASRMPVLEAVSNE